MAQRKDLLLGERLLYGAGAGFLDPVLEIIHSGFDVNWAHPVFFFFLFSFFLIFFFEILFYFILFYFIFEIKMLVLLILLFLKLFKIILFLFLFLFLIFIIYFYFFYFCSKICSSNLVFFF